MKYLKIIIPIVLIILLAGGGYAAYDVYQDEQIAKAKAEAQAKVEKEKEEARIAQEESLKARTKCVSTDAYSIVTLDHDGNVGQDILVHSKADGQDCKYDSSNAVFEVKNSDPEYYKFQVANALVTDVGTGPSGRSIRLYDLTDKKLITEKKYFGDLKLSSTTLTYMGESKTKATASNCKDYNSLIKDGLSAVLTVEKNVDLKTFGVKEGKTTTCVAVQ